MSIELLLGVINVDDRLRLLRGAEERGGFMARDTDETLKFADRRHHAGIHVSVYRFHLSRVDVNKLANITIHAGGTPMLLSSYLAFFRTRGFLRFHGSTDSVNVEPKTIQLREIYDRPHCTRWIRKHRPNASIFS